MKKILLRQCRLHSQSNKSISILSSAVFIFVFFGIYLAEATPYYLDPKNGNTGWDGTKMTHVTGTNHGPWKIVDQVNNFIKPGSNPPGFMPGDIIYIAKGTTVYGQLQPKGSGNSTSQIIIDAYGSGNKPIIDASKMTQGYYNPTYGILLYNQSYWTIQNLEVRNWWSSTTTSLPSSSNYFSSQGFRNGIEVIFDGNSSSNHGIRILHNTVRYVFGSYLYTGNGSIRDFYQTQGIGVYAWSDPTGTPYSTVDDVLIEGNQVSDIVGQGIHFVGMAGDKTTSFWAHLCKSVIVRGNKVTRTAAGGIEVSGTANELIEYDTVYDAGALGVKGTSDLDGTYAIVGIWVTQHQDGIIQYNEVARTKLFWGDGQAFDNDVYLSGTTKFQYNYSHDNEGGFFMECGPELDPKKYVDDGSPCSIVRYNISQNDGSCTADPNYPGKFIHTTRDGGQYYNNSFYCNLSCFFNLLVWSSNNNFFNNIFDGPTINMADDPNYINNVFDYNCYTFTLYPPSDANALVMNPLFVNAGGAVDGISSAQQCYKLTPPSPCIGTGMGISNNGGLDFWGNPLHYDNPERGAYELDQGDMTMEKILSSGKLICFLRKSNKNLYYMIQTTAGANNSWPSTWSSLGGPALGSIAAIKGWSDHALYVFAKDNNNTLRYRCLPSNSNTWADWKPLPTSITGGGNNFKVGSKIAVDTFSDNRIAVFAKGDDDHLYYLKQTGSSTFSPSWTSLSTNTAVGDKIAISLDNGGKMQVFANSTSNQVLGQSQTAKGSNGPWNADFFYYSAHSGVDASGGLAVAMNQNKALQVFAASANSGKISTMYQDPANLFNWTSWTDIATTPVQNITAGVNSDGRLELFFWGYSRMLDHIWQNGVNGYTSWYSPGNYMGVQESQQGLGGNYIGVINNNASTWNLSVFLLNDKTPQGTGLYSVGYLYQNTSITGYWSSVYWFSDN